MKLQVLIPVFSLLLVLVTSNTPLTDAFIHQEMARSDRTGYGIAWLSRPMWHLSRMRLTWFLAWHNTCYPSAALDSSGKQHGNQPGWFPTADGGCPDPGPRGEGKPFPTYWVVKQCSENEVRVIYALYFQHDGFVGLSLAKGHKHDWERIIVVWNRDPLSKTWTRSKLLMSTHSGYTEVAWTSVESTFHYNNTSEDKGKNKDAAKIYVGWAKHPNYHTVETNWRDENSQGCQREYRAGNDWWYLPKDEDMIWSAGNSSAAKEMMKFDWGSATGGPWVIEPKACDAKNGGFIPC